MVLFLILFFFFLQSDMKKNLSDDTNWNSLFLNPNAILETVATRYGVKKVKNS